MMTNQRSNVSHLEESRVQHFPHMITTGSTFKIFFYLQSKPD